MVKDPISDAGGPRFESHAGRVTGKPTPSLWRDKHPAIKGLRPPEHHAGKFRQDQQDSSESNKNTKNNAIYTGSAFSLKNMALGQGCLAFAHLMNASEPSPWEARPFITIIIISSMCIRIITIIVVGVVGVAVVIVLVAVVVVVVVVVVCLTRRSLCGPDGISLRGALEAGGP